MPLFRVCVETLPTADLETYYWQVNAHTTLLESQYQVEFRKWYNERADDDDRHSKECEIIIRKLALLRGKFMKVLSEKNRRHVEEVRYEQMHRV